MIRIVRKQTKEPSMTVDNNICQSHFRPAIAVAWGCQRSEGTSDDIWGFPFLGTQKWMVYRENAMKMDDDRGYPAFQETSI